MRALALAGLLLAAVAGGCGADEGSAAESATELRITLWPQGEGKRPTRRYTLRCNPAGGTLPRARRACEALGRLRRAFAPVPRTMACTELYGGPSEALVTGTFAGRPVRARFDRTDGCRIARWDRHRFLLPGEPTGH